MKRARYARRVRTWDADGNEGEGMLRERNGNLAWVERDDGRGEWLAPRRKGTAMSDLLIEDHGSVVLLRPLSAAGKAWVAEHVRAEGSWQWLGGALACEPRMAPAVVEGAESDGLVVER